MDLSVHSYAKWKDPKSLAQVWMCSRHRLKVKALKLELFKYGKIEDIQAQEVDTVFLLILKYRYVVLSRGMQFQLNDQVKVLLEKP
jgi:hypothetical protein